MRTGTKVENNVAKEAELVPDVTFSAEVEVLLSLAEPTLGSLGCGVSAPALCQRPQPRRKVFRMAGNDAHGKEIDLSLPRPVLCDILHLCAASIPYRGIPRVSEGEGHIHGTRRSGIAGTSCTVFKKAFQRVLRAAVC